MADIEALIETPDEPPPYRVMWGRLPAELLRTALEIGSKCGCNPRDSRKRRSDRLTEAMTEGNWKDGVPDMICLCEHGGICNGRHRSLASEGLERPLTSWIGIAVPQELIDCTDDVLKRQPGDALGRRGVEKYRLALGAAIRVLWLYDAHRSTHWTRWNKIRFPTYKIGQLFDEHYSQIEDIVDRGRQIESGTHVCPSAAFAFAYLLKRAGGDEKLAEIAQVLAIGTWDETDLLVKARNRLSGEATNRSKKADPKRPLYELGLLITATMAREANKGKDDKDKRKTFTFGDKSPMPELAFSEQLQVAV